MKFLKTIICIFVMFNFCSYIMATQQIPIDNGYTFKCFCLKQPLQQVQQELKLRKLNDEDFTIISFNSEQISDLTKIMEGLQASKTPWVSVKDLSDMYVASFLKADKENIISLSFLVFAVSCSINLDDRHYELGREILFDKLFQISDGAGKDVTMQFLGKMSACTDFIKRYSIMHETSFKVKWLQSFLTEFQSDKREEEVKRNNPFNGKQNLDEIINKIIEYKKCMNKEMFTHALGAVIFQPFVIPH